MNSGAVFQLCVEPGRTAGVDRGDAVAGGVRRERVRVSVVLLLVRAGLGGQPLLGGDGVRADRVPGRGARRRGRARRRGCTSSGRSGSARGTSRRSGGTRAARTAARCGPTASCCRSPRARTGATRSRSCCRGQWSVIRCQWVSEMGALPAPRRRRAKPVRAVPATPADAGIEVQREPARAAVRSRRQQWRRSRRSRRRCRSSACRRPKPRVDPRLATMARELRDPLVGNGRATMASRRRCRGTT